MTLFSAPVPDNQSSIDAKRSDLPLVSVVIPTYNRAIYLPETVDSVLAQTYPNIEIIVVDDGSTDQTAHVMEKYAGKVTYRRKPNGGVASARNLGLELARGDYVAFVDSDDLCVPERIGLQVAILARMPDAVLCSSDFSAFDGSGIIEASHITTYYRVISGTPGGLASIYERRQSFDREQLCCCQQDPEVPVRVLYGPAYQSLPWGNFIHPPTIMVRRAAIIAAGTFDETIPIATEYDWIIRVCKIGNAAYIDLPLLLYRYSDDQLSSALHSEQIALDAITALQNLRRNDPTFVQRNQRRFRHRIGTCYLHAADASLERDKFVAAAQLGNSLRHGVFALLTLKIIGKLVLPRSLLDQARRFRRRRRGTSDGKLVV